MSYNDFDGGLTQRSECYFHIVEVVGSIPISPTIFMCVPFSPGQAGYEPDG